jgi:hypothetical protein
MGAAELAQDNRSQIGHFAPCRAGKHRELLQSRAIKGYALIQLKVERSFFRPLDIFTPAI